MHTKIDRYARARGCWTAVLCFFGAIVLINVYALLMTGREDLEHAKTRAKNDLIQTITALRGFYTEYGYLPFQESLTSDVRISSDNQDELYAILRGKEGHGSFPEKIWNKNEIVFIELRQTAGRRSKSGFGGDGIFHDPWGRAYEFVLDTNLDGKVAVPAEWRQPDSGVEIQNIAIGYSAGKSDSPNDDIRTWR